MRMARHTELYAVGTWEAENIKLQDLLSSTTQENGFIFIEFVHKIYNLGLYF